MKFCPYCGAELITEGAQFCAECGKEMPAREGKRKKRDLEKPEEPLQEYRSRKKPAVKEKEAGEKRQEDKNKLADSFEEKEQTDGKRMEREEMPERKPFSGADDYDGYYDDILPEDEGHESEGLDGELVKKIILLLAVVFFIIGMCVALMYVL